MTDDEYRALQEQAHLVTEMMKHKGWDVLVDYLDLKMRGDKLKVLNNNVEDFDEYRKISGRLVGITYAIQDAPREILVLPENETRRRAEDVKPGEQ